MAKKPVKPAAKKPAAKAAKPAAKAAKPAAKAAAPAKPAAPQPAPADAAPAVAKAKPQLPPRPVPAHQQFLGGGGKGGVKPQHMVKARIIRHQGR